MQTTSDFLREKYYLVIELPFDIRLLYYQSFSHLDDAENEQVKMPYFKIVPSTSLDKWEGKTLIVPIKKARTSTTYIINVQAEISVEANSPDEAHNKARSKLIDSGINSVKTVITRKRELTKL